MTAELPSTILPRVQRMIRLLDSPQDGEVLAAARALQRTLAEKGLSFHDLAAAVRTSTDPSTLRRQRTARTPTPDPPPFYRTKPKWDDLRGFQKRDWLTVFLNKLQLSPSQKALISDYRVKLNTEEPIYWQPSKQQLHLVKQLLDLAWKAGARP